MSDRLKTGPIYVEGDWPGIFIRGDNALAYAMHLECILPQLQEMDRSRFAGFVRLMRKCDARGTVEAQRVELVYPASAPIAGLGDELEGGPA